MDLNDNSDDFDSFFNTKTTSSQQKYSKGGDIMEDLFGLEDKTNSQTSIARKSYTQGSKPAKYKGSIKEDPEDDADLGFDPKKPKASGKNQKLLDDLLVPLETKRPQTSTGSNTKATISRQSTDTTTDTSNLFHAQPVRPKTSQGRRASNVTTSQIHPDPLGLFAKDKENSKPSSQVTSPKTRQKSSTVDWLGLSKEPEILTSKKETISETTKTILPRPSKSAPPAKESIEPLKVPDSKENLITSDSENYPLPEEEEPKAEPTQNNDKDLFVDSTSQNLKLLSTLNSEAQRSFSTLKYQEQQLIMAAQMKQQEQVLRDMQLKQDSLLQKQEQQFQNLFHQQMHRHQRLEELIEHQQQRINNHLQLMMSQPQPPQSLLDIHKELPAKGGNPYETPGSELSSKDSEKIKQNALELMQLESDNKRLELENLRLEELIANTKSNYEREFELLERSYKKQIEVLEKHLTSVEKRLKSELEDQQTHSQNKIEVLEQEKNTLKKAYEEELSNLKQDHEDDLRKIRKNQEEEMEMLTEDHRRMLDNIRQTKLLEFAAVQENGSYLNCLKVASDNLQDLSGGLSELKENMKQKIETLHLEREKKLELREKQLEDNERRLKIIEEANELEKQRLMELVSNLELQLGKLSKDSAEDNWQLKQKLASLDAEKLAFNKEKVFFREQIIKDEERIKVLKEQQLLEMQNMQAQLQEERVQFQLEKTKYEMEKRLQNNSDLQSERLEIETTMQVAQDAVRKSDLERERFFKMQRQLEQQKRELSDKEHYLNMKEEELHQELLSYRVAERAAQETQQKAKIVEKYYQNKLHLLQQKSNEIAEKEASLSQERLLLSQDRLALHALKTKLLQQPKCSLCQLAQKNEEIAQNLSGLAANSVQQVNPKEFPNYDFLQPTNIVERLLDANIADSLKKMRSNSNLALDWENLLDDDHKKMVKNDEYEIPGQ